MKIKLYKNRELLEISPVQIDTILSVAHLTLDDTSLLDYIEYFKVRLLTYTPVLTDMAGKHCFSVPGITFLQ